MPRPGGPRVAEKPKNLLQTLKRIIGALNKWSYIMGLALFLAKRNCSKNRKNRTNHKRNFKKFFRRKIN